MATSSLHQRLNDEEVFSEMKKMVAFIKQEALEKAREIKVKADEEFNIEKAKLVRQESINIEAASLRKLKQAEVERKIAESNLLNRARLKCLQARDDMLNEVFAEARELLGQISKKAGPDYQETVVGLIVQGLEQLNEEKVVVVVRKEDAEFVRATGISQAKELYKKKQEREVEITLSEDEWLNEESMGGVIVTAHDGRIRCLNTFQHRLELASDQTLPELRVSLFGPSPSRKFFN